MKILYVTRRFYPEVIGGGQISAYYIAKALKDLGNEVFVCTFTLDKYKEEKLDGIHIYRFPLHYINLPLLSQLSNLEYMYLQMAIHTDRIIREIKPDVVHALNMESIPSTAFITKILHKLPFFATINGPLFVCFEHGHAVDYEGKTCVRCSPPKMLRCVMKKRGKTHIFGYILRFFKWIYGLFHMYELKFFAKRANRLLPVSNAMKKLLVNAGYKEDQLRVIHNPITIHNKVKTDLKGRLEIQDKRIILYAGRITESKGVQNIIKAMRNIDNSVFLIIGRGEHQKKLEKMVSDYKIENKVKFMGFMEHDKLGEYYSITDLVVLPCNFYEPLSRMLLEACSYGIPVIASDVGGNSEIVENGKNGILLKSLRIEELVDAINYIFNNPEVYKRMSRYCKEKVEREFSSEKIENQILDEYKKAVIKNEI